MPQREAQARHGRSRDRADIARDPSLHRAAYIVRLRVHMHTGDEQKPGIGAELRSGRGPDRAPELRLERSDLECSDAECSDSDIAVTVQCALKRLMLMPPEVVASVRRGLVTLEGQVKWGYQRGAAELASRFAVGVVGVVNLLTLKPERTARQIIEGLQTALQLQAKAEAIVVEVEPSR